MMNFALLFNLFYFCFLFISMEKHIQFDSPEVTLLIKRKTNDENKQKKEEEEEDRSAS